MNRFIYSIVLVLISSIFSLATIINVPADSATIQGGINLAIDSDTVLVQPGIYVENINFNGKNIVVGSLTLTTDDTSYISQTVIDGSGMLGRRCVTFENGEDSTAVLCGFTLANVNEGGHGAGIYLNNSSPRLSFLMIKNNIAGWDHELGGRSGGGIYCENSISVITNVIVQNNVSQKGGGIFCLNSDIVLDNVVVSGNKS